MYPVDGKCPVVNIANNNNNNNNNDNDNDPYV